MMVMGPLARLSLRSAVVLLCALFLYTGALWLLLSHRPNLKTASADAAGNSARSDEDSSLDQPPLQFPTSIPELQALVAVLQQYRESHFLYLLTLFSAAYVYKQTFAIPGSALMNVLGGALLGVSVAVPLVCLLTAVGASCCYLLSSFSLAQLLLHYQPHRVHWLRDKLTSSSSSLILLLVSLRVFPGTPNWFLNVASPVAGVPLKLFFPSVLIGLAPYNSVCVVAGASVSQLQSVSDLWSGSSLAVLVLLAVLAYAGSRVAAPSCPSSPSPSSSPSPCPSSLASKDAREKTD